MAIGTNFSYYTDIATNTVHFAIDWGAKEVFMYSPVSGNIFQYYVYDASDTLGLFTRQSNDFNNTLQYVPDSSAFLQSQTIVKNYISQYIGSAGITYNFDTLVKTFAADITPYPGATPTRVYVNQKAGIKNDFSGESFTSTDTEAFEIGYAFKFMHVQTTRGSVEESIRTFKDRGSYNDTAPQDVENEMAYVKNWFDVNEYNPNQTKSYEIILSSTGCGGRFDTIAYMDGPTVEESTTICRDPQLTVGLDGGGYSDGRFYIGLSRGQIDKFYPCW